MSTLSIVIPTYCGSETVPGLLLGLSTQPFPPDLQVVLVDDGSPDRSADAIEAWLSASELALNDVTLVQLARNFGEHNAVMAGLSLATGDLVITMDDDLQHRPEDAVALFEFLRENGAVDVVFAELVDKQHARWRNLGSRFNGWLVGRLIGKPRGLKLSTFRCIRRRLVDDILDYPGPFPYVDGLILERTHRVANLPVVHLRRQHGRSGYSARRLLALFLSVATGFSVVPLRLSLGAGGILGLSGIGMAVFALGNWVVRGEVAGWTSIFVAISLLSGIQLLLLGLVGEYVGRILMTANRRPQHAIRQVQRFPIAVRTEGSARD